MFSSGSIIVLVLTFRTVNFIELNFTMLSCEGRGSLFTYGNSVVSVSFVADSFPYSNILSFFWKISCPNTYEPHSELYAIPLIYVTLIKSL